ncbi:hypothetical protein KGQ31_01740 [Patescibacteria group bacterium]|nr:hypothetical protein [Patescibacteria group bacterium]
MLYVIYGDDWKKARAKAREILDGLKVKKPDAVVVNLGEGGVSEAKLEELAGSQGLFERKFIVFADRVCSDAAAASAVAAKSESIGTSENVFVFLEGELKADLLKQFKKYASKVQEFKLVEKKERFNTFALADALGERDRGRLWVLYQKASRAGISAEELLGVFFWQIKNMIAAASAKSALEAGLSPYVFMKSKRYSANFSVSELKNAASAIIYLYHDAHRGFYDVDIGLERFALSV